MASTPKITLLKKTSHLQTLLSHFTTSLTATQPYTHPPIDSPNPLALLRDASHLLKAQTTKLSLLLINEPFTPSACVKVLDACESQALPAIMGALELCHSDIWGGIMAREVRLRVEGLLSAFGEILLDVRRKVEGGIIEVLAVEREREKTLASTGLVWGACDGLVELEKMGLVGLTVWKVEEFQGMIVDAIGELKEWGEDEEDLDEGFGGSEGDGGDDVDDFEDMFSAANKLPSHRTDLKELLEEALRQLKLVDMLYKAMAKRRMKTFPVKTQPLEDEEARAQVKTLDEVVAVLKSIPESVDDLANAFYELDAEEATSILTKITTDAKAVATKVEKSWTNTSDEFTTWRTKFGEALSKKAGKEEEGKAKQTMTLPLRSK
ncbi:hypothetical protein E2P81_ATG04072 [Venturia nashicola]|uniref:Cyclin-D1-binding protein 1-like N-terminal domain-containing protein n=1 Tax=Venturia nashicola TaxID=86259 RepID=A0A4Z1P753_9PEZI|nr:hypothetical protein E6O75_ATG04172 [Venturia nashicola]TLD37260.1 hypothetical protein E2P81_ATG04072 [Venturia nashicola]